MKHAGGKSMPALPSLKLAVSRLLGPILALGISSCATPGSEGFTGVISVPGHWHADQPGSEKWNPAILTKWWQQFRDPVLNELVQSALAASPDTRTAISKIAESRARRRVEIASFFPWIVYRQWGAIPWVGRLVFVILTDDFIFYVAEPALLVLMAVALGSIAVPCG